MCNKSLPTVRCRTIGLCGISDRFQSLSPTKGQVAHALLTRPPLIRGRSPVTVRLECVMHAASVNPEPGSNSRNHGILTPRRRGGKINSELDCSLLFLKSISLFRIVEIFSHLLCFVLSLVVQFSRIISCQHSRVDLSIIPLSLELVKRFFKVF